MLLSHSCKQSLFNAQTRSDEELVLGSYRLKKYVAIRFCPSFTNSLSPRSFFLFIIYTFLSRRSMFAIIIILFFKFKTYTSSTAVFKLWYFYDGDMKKPVADSDYANLNVEYFA